MSKNMRKMRHKVCSGQNLPHESPNFTNYFFQSNFTYNLSQFPQVSDHITKTVFFYFFSTLTTGCLRTCVFGLTYCVMPKRASVQLLHGQMTWFNWLSKSSFSSKFSRHLHSQIAHFTSEKQKPWTSNLHHRKAWSVAVILSLWVGVQHIQKVAQ